MKLKTILFIFLFIFNVFASAIDIQNLTSQQLETLKKIKEKGEEHDLGYTLMAIAIKESKLGQYMINDKTHDFGLYQANIKTVLSRHNITDTAWNRDVLASKLITDFQFATKNAIAELTYWQKIHKNDWTKVWGSYNAGFKYNSKEARDYSQDIAAIIKELKKIDV
ncbi:transglycosylase SLT domain-containing protein [Arcobacter lacus]|uniref:Transglycosylase SLT domain-containing protein n=1 Tax=Arcobacter lacus TaxID=1912876 RepID=A0ABX5JKC5_9BACT|nr:transglycosylase SLT domain-containing protein [Arcobacter lacus]MCT7910033.1 transglycosylase SLT domain-containing protein [Arcobacter lacus]MCT7912187.1 transglycosylase SLT domain-containing protein [Arcobacter lacus]PUE64898.1 hypothetical protein B0175_10875 [Arcobacter lacus]